MPRVVLLPLAAVFLLAPQLRAQEPTPAQQDFFAKKVQPILVEHCFKCHSHDAKKPKGGLLLDSRAAVLQGGDNGPALVPGQPQKSKLIEAIHYKNPDLQMPPKAKLPDAVIADLERWIADGAPWSGKELAPVVKSAFDLAKRKAQHWAWQPVHAAQTPAVKDTAWPRDPLDAYVLAKLEAKNLKPAAPADRRTLIRRLSFDLIGLPPRPDEVEAFVNDHSPAALDKVVDRLLASPHFGERWGRHWLDLMRYGESRGHEFDITNPNAYQYRDYVIRALNADVPYNQFVMEHLAGDLLPNPRLHPTYGFNESILGTGFYFLGEQLHSPVDITADKADRFDNTIDVIGKAFLGLTVACARCHDHKFDAISTKDYYALFGFLESSSYRQVPFESLEHNRQIAAELAEVRHQAHQAMQREFKKAIRPGVQRIGMYLEAASPFLAGRRLRQLVDEGLDERLLKRWREALAKAAKNPDDLLHPVAVAFADPDQSKWRLMAAHLKEREDKAAKALAEMRVVVDYRNLPRDQWLPDGFAFGPAPRPAGVTQVTGPDKQTRLLFEEGGAVADRAWDGLHAAPGVDIDPGGLGKVPRTGRTLRTPTFDLRIGKVYYLVKGAASVYAGVDGHVMVDGPLHTGLIRTFKTGDALQWIEHDLRPYKGKRGFLEFTPLPGADLTVAMVVESAQTPELPVAPTAWLAALLTKREFEGRGDLVRNFAWAFKQLLRSGIPNVNREVEPHFPALRRWLVEHRDLLDVDPQAVDKQLAKVAAPFHSKEALLIARIQKTSHYALGILDGSGVDEHVYIRGSYKTPGEKVPRRFLEALAGPDGINAKGSGRLEFAEQMTDPDLNPLIARVIVNRLWHHLFGRGIVATTDNFGVLGEAPTHPQLLDHLADRFVRDGWSLKKMIRTIVLSRTYQMSYRRDAAADTADPGNLLLHRANLRRLEGEAIRDAMLAVSGRLDVKQFGPAVPVHLTPFQDGRGRPASGPLDGAGRRSIYLSVRRNFLPPFLLAFDTPTPFSPVGRRTVSNVPAQALILLNDPFVHQQAAVWAKRVQQEKGTPTERVTFMYLSAFSRPPTEGEMRRCLEFVETQGRLNPGDATAAWTDLAHVLFNAKEFIFQP